MNYETRKNLWLIAVALAFAVIAATLATAWMKSRIDAVETKNKKLTTAVIAARDVPLGKRLEQDDVRVVRITIDGRPKDAFQQTNQVVGQVSRSQLYEGEVLTARRVSQYAGGSALAAVLKPGMRAIAIRVDDVIGVAGFVLPENRVDVIATFDDDGSSHAETIIKDARVLAVDQRADLEADGPIVGRAVTIEVTPEDAEKIAVARQRGLLQLSLRNPTAPTVVGVLQPEKVASVMPEVIVVSPPPTLVTAKPTPPRRESVTLIRGTTITTGYP